MPDTNRDDNVAVTQTDLNIGQLRFILTMPFVPELDIFSQLVKMVCHTPLVFTPKGLEKFFEALGKEDLAEQKTQLLCLFLDIKAREGLSVRWHPSPGKPSLTRYDFDVAQFIFLADLIDERDWPQVVEFVYDQSGVVPAFGQYESVPEGQRVAFFQDVTTSLTGNPEREKIIKSILEKIGELGEVRAKEALLNRKR